MKTTIYILKYLLFIILLLGCKNIKKQESLISEGTKSQVKLDSVYKNDYVVQDSLISKLPIGNQLLLLNELGTKAKDLKKLENLFHHYDSINGIPSPYFKPIKVDKYTAFYKPTKADTINVKDIFALQSKIDYSYFDLVKVIQSKNSNQLLIFEGRSSIYDYDGNIIHTNRKDLVIVDSEMNIIDELNVYYNYSDGVNARTKLFFIDKNYIISIRYYFENEEGESKFTSIEKFKITNDGKILKYE